MGLKGSHLVAGAERPKDDGADMRPYIPLVPALIVLLVTANIASVILALLE